MGVLVTPGGQTRENVYKADSEGASLRHVDRTLTPRLLYKDERPPSLWPTNGSAELGESAGSGSVF